MLLMMDRNGTYDDELKAMGNRDILIGIPSYKNEDTISYVVEVAGKGLEKYFAGYSAVIMNSDGNSPDLTRQQVQNADIPESIDRIISIYSGISGKGSAFRNIFETARSLRVKACVVVDSDLRSITPEWIKLLLEPVLNNEVDYLAPLYLRHKYDGTITNNIVYPLTRALYGKDIRQPIGGDFGFSSKLLDFYLLENVWETDIARYGIDIWMTTTAIVNDFRVGQAALGAKIHDAKDPAVFLAPMFRQVVGTSFSIAGRYPHKWAPVNKIQETGLFGEPFDKEPEPVNANYDALVAKFTGAYEINEEYWQKYLTENNFILIKTIRKNLETGDFSISEEQWAHIVYDFLVSFNRFRGEEELVLDAMTPLYFLKIADFMNKSRNKNTRDSENMIIKQADTFLAEKNYLLSQWEQIMGKLESERQG